MTLLRSLLLSLLVLPWAPAWTLEEQGNIDPWEPLNRHIFAFNETLDKYALLPAARGYRFIMPEPAQRGVSNFISNIYEVNSALNFLLQGRPGNAFQSAGRFLVNTTMGLAGLFDVATPMGIERSQADFGQTLYEWGFESGPYVMLPVFGPRTVRGSVGYFVDTYTSIPAYIDDQEWAYLFWAAEAIDLRAQLIKADDLIFGDRYIFVRNAYLQRRAYFLSGKVDDSFSAPDEEDDYEEF